MSDIEMGDARSAAGAGTAGGTARGVNNACGSVGNAGGVNNVGGTAGRTAGGAGIANGAEGAQVLVVEDDRAVRNLVATALEMHGYRVQAVEAGAAAILEAASKTPDLVMLDLGLPDIDGAEVIAKIRSWSAVPIIVISARTEDADKIGALDAGADDYLTKPFSVEELLARVRASLRRSRMAAPEATASSRFENGPLAIDFAAGCAWLDGDELHLTPIEYKLLVLLAKNVGKVLTHTFITREIWGTSWDSDIASLRVFMRTLRKKVEHDPSHPVLIQTHVGVGYRMQRL